VVKPNIAELGELAGMDITSTDELFKATAPILKHGVKLVVVSMGADGAWFITKDEAIKAAPPKTNVVSTVGAGDAMVAGIVAAQLRKLSLEDCAKLATSFSVDAVGRVEAGLSPNAAAIGDTVRIDVQPVG
jgi:fructose-1-phosphate kinase PfkB-like protein